MESGQHWVGEVRAGERYASVLLRGESTFHPLPGDFSVWFDSAEDNLQTPGTVMTRKSDRKKERDITHSASVSESYGSFMSTKEEERRGGRGERSLPLENVTACAACP